MGRVTEESNINYLRNHLRLDRTYQRRDICRHLGIDANTKLEDIFIREKLEYRKHPEMYSGSHDAVPYFLVNVEFPFNYIRFDSGVDILSRAILYPPNDTKTLLVFVDKKYPVLYNGSNYIVSTRVEFPSTIEYRCSFNLCRIRQKMLDDGYSVYFDTSLNEICRMLGLDRDQQDVKRKVCERIGIRYYPHARVSTDSTPKEVYSIDCRGQRLDFNSIKASANYFNLSSIQLARYIDNNVRFMYNDLYYRVYYV